MGRELERITPELTEFLEAQPVFFVATAPESTNHHVNVILATDPEAVPYLERLASPPGARSVIVVDVTRVSSSCGFAVPLTDFVGERTQLTDWPAKHGEEGLAEYREKKNATSISGLPGWS